MRKSFATSFGGAGLVVALMVCLVSCGSSPIPVPDIATGPTRASISASASNAVLDFSPLAGFNYRLSFDLTLRETAGLGANLNFIRGEFQDSSGRFLERQEAGSNQLNRLSANGTLTGRVVFDFNDARSAVCVVTISATDDKGNPLESQFRINL